MLPTVQRMAELLDGVVLMTAATPWVASASRTSVTSCALRPRTRRRR